MEEQTAGGREDWGEDREEGRERDRERGRERKRETEGERGGGREGESESQNGGTVHACSSSKFCSMALYCTMKKPFLFPRPSCLVLDTTLTPSLPLHYTLSHHLVICTRTRAVV